MFFLNFWIEKLYQCTPAEVRQLGEWYDSCPCSTDSVPASRWVVNFDFDLLDGLVLAAVVGAYVPFVVSLKWEEYFASQAFSLLCKI